MTVHKAVVLKLIQHIIIILQLTNTNWWVITPDSSSVHSIIVHTGPDFISIRHVQKKPSGTTVGGDSFQGKWFNHIRHVGNHTIGKEWWKRTLNGCIQSSRYSTNQHIKFNLRTQIGGSSLQIPIASIPLSFIQVLTLFPLDTSKKNPVVQL